MRNRLPDRHQVSTQGDLLSKLKIPTDQLVTSFSSKSELALNLSTSGREITFMSYVAPKDGIDISNSNTPAVPDPTNPVSSEYYRGVAALNPWGELSVTQTNADSGNNGRAAIANDSDRRAVIYTAGNAGNGSSPQPNGVLLGAGAQIIDQMGAPEGAQSPGTPTPVGSFSIAQLGDKPDKIGKDDNFRGETISGNVLYYTKGSGSNGTIPSISSIRRVRHAPRASGSPRPERRCRPRR